jgi:hypothetical protein
MGVEGDGESPGLLEAAFDFMSSEMGDVKTK